VAVEANASGADARNQLARIEWLREIVVRTAFESANAIVFVAASGQHDDGHLRTHANSAQHFAAVAAGKHHVKNYELVILVQAFSRP
jgi:hypothetical protein